MNLYALAIGIVIAIYLVIRFRKMRLENKKWAYSVVLATFPVYYWVFAVYASDYDALAIEVIIGFVFFAIAYMAYKLNSFMGLLLLAIGYIAHAVYDVAHNSFFYNLGTPQWWPELCGAVDILIGLYLVFFAASMRQRKAKIS